MMITKKSLGQHWLVNPQIHREIVKAADLRSTDLVLEIGPGTGLLTEHLAQSGARVLAIEKDEKLAAQLQAKFAHQKNVRIIASDILKFDPQNYRLRAVNYKLVGNLPYYLTSHLIRTIFEKWPRPELMIFMVQKEVAQRIVAQPPEANLLSLAVQFYATAEILRSVSRKYFRPVPKVDSALIKISPQYLSPEKEKAAAHLFKIARAGFQGKRKKLLNSLSANLSLDKKKLIKVLEKSGLALDIRPQCLSIGDWIKLSSLLDFPF